MYIDGKHRIVSVVARSGNGGSRDVAILRPSEAVIRGEGSEAVF